MIKLAFCIKLQPHLSREEFLDYWLNTHRPLVRKHAQAMRYFPASRRYVQVHTARQHTLDDPLNEALRGGQGAPEAFDGVARSWWESKEGIQRAFTAPEGRAAGKELMEDEKKFIDHARSPLWIGEEKPMVGE